MYCEAGFWLMFLVRKFKLNDCLSAKHMLLPRVIFVCAGVDLESLNDGFH